MKTQQFIYPYIKPIIISDEARRWNMQRSFTRQFYLRYFIATQGVSWLARQSARQRLKLLEELMQWDVTNPVSDSAHPQEATLPER